MRDKTLSRLNRASRVHYGLLLVILLVGTGLRFWQLDSKPLWLDEVITALFVTGQGYEDIPASFSLANLPQLFTLHPASCSEIASHLLTQSTHPPGFFCLMHSWLNLLAPLKMSLTWQLRALPALFGVGATLMVYFLNRLAFSRMAGLLGAGIMAISPFGVYLSQEARHYTLPTLFISLALFLLIKIQKDLAQKQLKIWLWLLWGTINGLGLYIHYFYVLAFNAQVMTLLLLLYRYSKAQAILRFFQQPRFLLSLIFVGLLPLFIFSPWLPAFLIHFQSPSTDWLPAPQHIAPLYQTFIAFILMVVALPVENQPLFWQVVFVLLGVGIGVWIYWQGVQGLRRQLGYDSHSLWLLIVFTLVVMVQFFFIIYGLGKDISVAPRYSFIYFPSICALLGYSFANLLQGSHRGGRKITITLMIGIISSLLVTENLVFLKPFFPEQVAAQITPFADEATIAFVHEQPNDIALGLSYAIALTPLGSPPLNSSLPQTATFTFVSREDGYPTAWQELTKLEHASPYFWLIIPRGKQQDFPKELSFPGKTTCTILPDYYFRVGSPHQLYQCE